MKLIIDTRGFSAILILVVLSAVLVATVLLSSSIKSVLDIALAATQLEKGVKFSGVIFKGAPNRCKVQTEYTFCYKLFPNNGDPAIWVRPSAGLQSQFDSFLGKRVDITANKLEYTLPSGSTTNTALLPANDKVYYNVKSLNINPFDYTVNFGIGGLGSGQGPAERAELGVHSMNPGIYWSGIQPEANTSVASMRANLARYLDGTMLECKQKGMSCGIFIGGVPKYAVTQGLAKYKAQNNKELICGENNYPFPIDQGSVVMFANFVGEVAERYDGDGVNDAPNSPTASYIMLFNELDAKGANPTIDCGDPFFTTNKDLNANNSLDLNDYANMMEEVWRKVKNASGGKVALATSRYASSNNQQRKFVEDVMAYQFNKYPSNRQVFFDVFAMNYYDNSKSDPLFVDPYSSGTRGKINWAENLMKKYGGVKPIVFTELGYSIENNNSVEQANRLFQIFAQAFSKESVREVNWFTLFSGRYWQCCALIDTYTTETSPINPPVRKPAFNAFKIMQSNLGNTKFLTLEMADPNYIEGYIFIDPTTQKRKEVIWYNKRRSSDPDKKIIFDVKRAVSVRLTKPDGSIQEIKDNLTGDLNPSDRTIGIELTTTPVILEFSDSADSGPV